MIPVADRARSLYVHIPFCEQKCHYCDFVSVAGTRGEAAYVDVLRREIARLGEAAPGTTLDTIFFGGGTPGLLEPAHTAALMATIRESFLVAADAEITLEANPSSTSAARAAAWRGAGFNRVSLGVQSLHADILKFLGRVHDSPRALAAVTEVREGGFESVNCDLIYAVPGLDDLRWAATLAQIIALDPGHISCYELTVEEGTPLHRLVANGRVRPADADTALRQHWLAVDAMVAAGYAQYEVSNFSRYGRESRHNLAYWRNQPYLAAGVGAHGHVDPATASALGLDVAPDAVAVRYWHSRSIPAYIEAGGGAGPIIAGVESVTAVSRAEETIMLGLRLSEGLPEAAIAGAEADAMVSAGLLTRLEGRITATRRGQEVLNEVAARLITAA